LSPEFDAVATIWSLVSCTVWSEDIASIGYGVTGVLGALCGGALSDLYGLSSVYACSIATALLACVSAWQCKRQHAKH
jgi:predicted MFS family arabinose efflux permease